MVNEDHIVKGIKNKLKYKLVSIYLMPLPSNSHQEMTTTEISIYSCS